MNRMTDSCKKYYFSQTSFAGGKNVYICSCNASAVYIYVVQTINNVVHAYLRLDRSNISYSVQSNYASFLVSAKFAYHLSVADPGFSPGGGGAPTPKSAIIFQFFAENCMKMKEFGPPGGARVPGAPLGSANAYCDGNNMKTPSSINLDTLHVPCVRQKTIANKYFSVADPKLWNALRNDFQNCERLDQFQVKLKPYLLSTVLVELK